MLQTMRDNSKGVVAGILVGLLVIIFALSGAEALFSNRGSADVALTVNGQEITETEVARAIEQEKSQMRERFGDSVPEEFLSNENLRGPAIDRVIQRTLLTQAAEKADMAIADQRLNDIITSIPAFQNAEGQFDPQAYKMALARLAYTPATYKRELTRDMTINQLASGLSESNFATDEELQFLSALNEQTRDFAFVTLSADGLMEQVEVSDGEIESYYNDNTQRFTEPEKVQVEYIELSVDALMDDIELDETALREQYEQNIEDFTPSVERQAAHILLEEPSDALIAQIEADIEAGRDFAQMAQEYSDDLGSKDSGGDLGVSSGDAFPEDFEQALENLAVGEISGPVETDAGVHFIKLVSETGGEPTSFAQQRDTIANQIKRSRAETRFVETLERLEDLSYNAESLANVADELGLPLGTTEPFSRDGGAGIAGSSKVVEAAFGQEVLEYDNSSEVLELAPDRVVVVKKIDREPSYVKPLAQVREQIVSQLERDKARQLLAERGEAIVQRLRSGEAFESLAEEFEVSVQRVEAVKRSNQEQPRSVLEFAFSLPRPDETGSVVNGRSRAGEYTVVKLEQVTLPDESMPQEQATAMRQGVAGLYGNADFGAFTDYLRETAEIERKN